MRFRALLVSAAVLGAVALAPAAATADGTPGVYMADGAYTAPPTGVPTSTEGGTLHEADGATLTVDPEATTAATNQTGGRYIDSSCQAAMVKVGAPSADVTKYCTVVTEVATTAVTSPTKADVAAMRTQTPALPASWSGSSAHCQSWHMYKHVLPDWSEKTSGRFCWGNKQVWVWSYPGTDPGVTPSGYHYCHQGWAVLGYHIHTDHCNIVRVNDGNFYGGYFRQNWDRYTVTFGYGIFSIDYSTTMHANVFPSGALTFHFGK